METRKLYYEDCMLREFSAVVTGCAETKGGFLVTLDQTGFYPEGGGQPCDIGTLGGVAVVDVQEKDEQILHLCDGALTVGSTVTGKIDWSRRFDLMQQHTGEHIVSGIIHALYGAHNVGFHMGNDVITIDFDVAIPADALSEIQQKANQAIFENLPVLCTYPRSEALPGIPYRSKKALLWPVRIVEIPGYDICACCGVHVAYTGQIGMIKLLSCVKFHEGVRMEMVCGWRAMELMDKVFEQNRQVSQAFSAKILETGAAARRMNEAFNTEKFRATGLTRQLFELIAGGYARQGDVVHFAEGLEPTAIRELADKIATVCDGTAAVFSGSDKDGYGVCMVNKSADIKALGQAMNQELDGRGGGKPGFFQGSVKATKAQILAFFAR